jgi:hypothetical protein
MGNKYSGYAPVAQNDDTQPLLSEHGDSWGDAHAVSPTPSSDNQLIIVLSVVLVVVVIAVVVGVILMATRTGAGGGSSVATTGSTRATNRAIADRNDKTDIPSM